MSRTKNAAGPEDLKKLLRANHPHFDLSKCMQPDLDMVADFYCEFLLDALQVTPRPTRVLLEQTALAAYDRISTADAKAFGRQLSACMTEARLKAKSYTTGAKLSLGFQKLAKALKTADGSSQAVDRSTPQSSSKMTSRRCFSKQ